MSNIETIIRQINREFVPQFEEKLRAYLAKQDKEWLIEQIVRLSLDAHSLHEMDRKHVQEEENKKRLQRISRVKELKLDVDKLTSFISKYRKVTREQLIEENFLKADAPAKGRELITEEFRSIEGEELLQFSKDMLFGFLFGDEHLNIYLDRNQRELLSLNVPRYKSAALNFMKASTEISSLGTWQDPQGAASDTRADNIIMEIEFGETKDELVGDGIVAALKLINNLEVNEEILYGRMSQIEQSTLASQKLMRIQ